MSSNALPQQVPTESGLYANFPRRLNALTLDFVVLVGFSVITFTLTSFLQNIVVVRVALAAIWWVVLFLYEPIFVWRLGGTVGHRVMNLQVVNNRTGRGVSLLQALARYVIKGLLGIFSFLTMSFSKRHQAVHDMLTNSSVRIRDASKAQPHEYTIGPT